MSSMVLRGTSIWTTAHVVMVPLTDLPSPSDVIRSVLGSSDDNEKERANKYSSRNSDTLARARIVKCWKMQGESP